MRTKVTQNIKAIILGTVLILGAGYVSAWTGAPANPPSNNTPAPINVGGIVADPTTWQTKTGVLTLLHLFTPDLTITNSDGSTSNIASGSVLVADGNNTGKVKWGSLASNPPTISDTTLDPIICWAQTMASDGANYVVFKFAYSGLPQPSSAFSTSDCYYSSDTNKTTRINIKPLVDAGAYVGVLKSASAKAPGGITSIHVTAGISADGGSYYTSQNLSTVNIVAVYIPTGIKIRQALNQ